MRWFGAVRWLGVVRRPGFATKPQRTLVGVILSPIGSIAFILIAFTL